MTYIVSACLLGTACRYDGEKKGCAEIIELGKKHTLIPFCPEDPLFGTPRPRINIVEAGKGLRVLRESDGSDVTDMIRDYTLSWMQKHPEADKVILKSKSPSCGLGTTPVLNGAGELIGYGNGIAAQCFLDVGMKCYDEFSPASGRCG